MSNFTKIGMSELGILDPEWPGKAKCKVCLVVMCARRDNMIRHYKLKHRGHFDNLGQSFQFIKSQIQTKEEYIENIIEITISCNLPFRFWNNPVVMKNQEGYMEQFGLTCTDNFMSELMTKYAAQLRNRMKKRLQNRLLCLKYDLIPKNKHHILSVSAQFVNDDWEQESWQLTMEKVPGTVTKDKIQEMIKEVCVTFDLKDKWIYSASTYSAEIDLDATSNTGEELIIGKQETNFDDADGLNDVGYQPIPMTIPVTHITIESHYPSDAIVDVERQKDKTAQDSYFKEPIWCAAQVINMTIKDFMGQPSRMQFLKDLKQKVQAVRTHITTLPVDDTRQRPNLPVLPADNLWSSQMKMLQSLHSVKTTVNLSGIVIDWTRVEELLAILKPISELTNKLRSSHYTPGDFMIDLQVCQVTIKRVIKRNPRFADAAKEMLNVLDSRKKSVVDSIQFRAALYMDPRIVHSTMTYFSQQELRRIEDFLMDLYYKVSTLDISDTVNEGESNPPTKRMRIESDLIELKQEVEEDDEDDEISLDMLVRAAFSSRTPTEPITITTIREKLQLMTCRRFDNVSVLDYWKRNSAEHPEVATLAAVVLSLPMSQFAIERAISQLDDSQSGSRGKSFDDILTVKLNGFRTDCFV